MATHRLNLAKAVPSRLTYPTIFKGEDYEETDKEQNMASCGDNLPWIPSLAVT